MLKDVPPGATVTGMRARIIKVNGKRVDECSACLSPDEMRIRIFRLEEELYLLKREIRQMKGEPEPHAEPRNIDVEIEHKK